MTSQGLFQTKWEELQKSYFQEKYSSLPSWSENCLFLNVPYTHWTYWRYCQSKAILTQTCVIHTYICLCVYTYVYTYPLSRAEQVLMSLFTYALCPICSTLVSNYIWIWLPLSSCKYMTLMFWSDIVKGKDFLSFVTKGFSKVSGCSDL